MINTIWANAKKYKYFYMLIAPTIIFYILFSYVPMYGIVMAFKDFNFRLGILGSPWVGLDNFKELLGYADFKLSFLNTIIISLGRIMIEFPVPVVLALMMNEITSNKVRRVYQTVYTFPHFLSWVILSGILTSNLLNDQGVLNQMLTLVGLPKQDMLINPALFRPLLFVSNIWKEMGWSAIIYLAAISGIDPTLYEAADIDGAGKFQRMIKITWPGIRSSVSIMFILAIGNSMNAGFDQIINLYNPGVYHVSDIIDTYIYRMTFKVGWGFGLPTAVGFMKSVLNLIFLVAANAIVKSRGEEGII